MAQLQFQDASIRLKDRSRVERRLLGPISFETDGNETIVLCGPTGSGKSLLLELAAGLRRPSDGNVLLDGRRIDRIPPADRGIGLLTQDAALYDHLSVRENIAFGLESEHTKAARVADAAAAACCSAVLDRNPVAGGLSGGERRRVALAKALAMEPRVLLLDEPFEGLDAVTHQVMRMELGRWLGSRRGPTLVALHDQADAIALADRILLLEAGRILQMGDPETLMRQPDSARVAQLFLPRTPGILSGRRKGTRLELPGGWIDYAAELPDGAVDVVVPPRAVRLSAEGLEGWKVLAKEPTHEGADHLLEHPDAARGEGLLRLSGLSPEEAPAIGTHISIALSTDDLLVFPSS